MTEDSQANQGPAFLAETWVLLTLALIFVGLRFLSRRVIKAGFWWDDLLAVISVLVALVNAIVATIAVIDYGLGRHAQYVGEEALIKFLQTLYSQQFLYLTVLVTAKLSILLYYWRIFNISSLKWPIYVLGIIIVLWYVGSVITDLTQCRPIQAFWNPTLGSCVSLKSTVLGIAIPNIVTDFFLMILPLPFIWTLRMRTWQKIGLSLAFALGSFVTVISIIRIPTAISNLGGSQDPTWSFIPLNMWSSAELCLAPMCASLPSIGPLIRKLVRGDRSNTAAYSTSRGLNNTTTRSQARRVAPEVNGLGNAKGFQRLDEDTDYNIALREMGA